MTGHDPLVARSRLLTRATTGAAALAVAAAAGTGLLTYKIAQEHAAASQQSGNPSGSPRLGTTGPSGPTSNEHEADDGADDDGGSGIGGSTQTQQQSPAGGSNGS